SNDIIESSVTLGISSSSPIQSGFIGGHYIDTLTIILQTSYDTYLKSIEYLKYSLFGMIFDDYNIIIEECEKQLKYLIEQLQDGELIQQQYFNCLRLKQSKSSYYHQLNIFNQKLFFENLLKNPEKYKKDILHNLEQIRLFIVKNLTQSHMTICGDCDKIKPNMKILEEFYNESKHV
ncbi:unnamed protein product, partial [Didymodactylos carnosus]